MKKIILLPAIIFLFLNCLAQEKNPLIESGPIINEGIELHDKGDYKEAIARYKKVPRSDTNYVWALYEMGMSYAADSQYNEALKVYREALALDFDREREPDLYNNLASLLDNMGEKEKALLLFDSAIKKYPAYSPLYLNKAITLLRLERNREAEEVLKKNLLMDPYSYSSHYMLGLAAMGQGKITPAFISFFSYLMMSPSGRYFQNSVGFLSIIASKKDELATFMENRSNEESEHFRSLEEILLSKIALDKNYKPLIKLDDPVCRQIQVLLEKVEFVESDPDFWMQYYVPLLRKIFDKGKFEPFIYQVFSNIDIETIQSYNKKNKKETQALIVDIVEYMDEIKRTRELVYSKRSSAETRYAFDEGKLSGKGKLIDNGQKSVGAWEYYYPAGNIRSTGNYNSNGERQGRWQFYFFDNTLKAVENYNNGLLEGETLFYYENGNLSARANYKNDLQEGTRTSFYLPGSRRTIENYKSGKLHGEKRIFYLNGSLHFIENYNEDSLHGVYESYYQDGQIEYRAQYENGKLTGVIKGWHNNGRLSYEGQYQTGEQDGEWKRYYPNGKLKTIENYKQGKLEGEYKEFHSNGQLYFSTNYVKGKVTGEIAYYDEEGKLFSKLVYKNDILQQSYYYNKEGKEIHHSAIKNKKMNFTSFGADRFKRTEAVYNEKGEVEGPFTLFYKNGQVKEIDQYQKGLLHGPSISYHLNGSKESETNYKEGVKDGYYTSYHLDSSLQSEGWYVNDQAEGQWLYYNPLGDLSTSAYYYNDDLHGIKTDYWPNKKPESETIYQYGWIKTYHQFDSNGNLIHTVDLKKGSGRFTTKHFNGAIRAEATYVNGNFDGPYKFYYFDGSLETIMYYKAGALDSIAKSYYYGGKIFSEGRYKMGEKDGTWKYYYDDGKTYLVENYAEGEINGKKIYYHENGKLESEISYENGKREGVLRKYNPNGMLIYQMRYEDDLPVAYSYEDKNGNLVPEILLPGGSGNIKAMYRNGSKSAELEYVEGKLNGKHILYYENGSPYFQSTETFNNSNGISREFYPNGKLAWERAYKNDNTLGPFTIYHENGQKKTQGTQYNDMMHGTIYYYDENGKLKETRYYYYDNLISVKK